MYEAIITLAIPGVETASTYRATPGFFGRPWQATTSEVVFYNTTIETSDFPGSEGKSLIAPLGWQNTLRGESSRMYEYGTTEESGENNSASRAAGATLLMEPNLADGPRSLPLISLKVPMTGTRSPPLLQPMGKTRENWIPTTPLLPF